VNGTYYIIVIRWVLLNRLNIVIFGVEALKIRAASSQENFKPEKEEVTGVWIKLQTEKLNNLYSSPDITSVIN
jgi:hypothetical protein